MAKALSHHWFFIKEVRFFPGLFRSQQNPIVSYTVAGMTVGGSPGQHFLKLTWLNPGLGTGPHVSRLRKR
jgi:hypothetical protein